MSVETVNQILSIATILNHLFLGAATILLFFKQSRIFIVTTLGKHGVLLAWSVALVATAFSLFYSEIVGFEPCKLCWLQRIFIYPQTILLGIAFFKKDWKIVDYVLPLTAVGMLFAFYHNYIYYGGTSVLPCSAFGLGVSCLTRYVFELGYVTIPLMSLTSFLLIGFFLLIQKMYNKRKAIS